MGRKTKMNDITSPELIAQVNPENMELMHDFLEYLRSVNRSETTIAGYESDLLIAWVWCLQNNNNQSFINWTKRNVVKFQDWLINTNENSPARVRRMRSSLSSLSNYICNILDDEFPNFKNIINKIEAPVNEPVREKTVLSDEEVEEILSKLVEKKKYEVACLFALAAFGGRRKAELCRFRVSDFSDEHLVCGGSLWRSSPIKTKGRGNGKFLNCYTLAAKFRPYLNMWMEERARLGIDSEWLFPDPKDSNKTMSATTVNSWMNSISRMTGRDIYAHSLRHYYTTFLSTQGLPDGVIKEIQGWKDISLVSVYVDRNTEETLDMYFDNGGIKNVKKAELSDL